MAEDEITVAGGGVAGLAVARALALGGREVVLGERAPEFGAVGAGLQISPNGLRVIDALGLGAALRAEALAVGAVTLHDWRGRRVLRMPLGTGYHVVHRARLIEVLLEGARDAGVTVRTGCELDAGRRRACALPRTESDRRIGGRCADPRRRSSPGRSPGAR